VYRIFSAEIGGGFLAQFFPTQKKEQPPNQVDIPRAFVEHPRVKYLFYHQINKFDYEEKVAIHFHHFAGMTVNEIADLTQLTHSHIDSVLQLYSERLTQKVCFFKSILPYNADEQLSVSEMLLYGR